MQGGLPPRIPSTTRLLLLGSFPGVVSLDQARYYAHPRNQFWRLVGACIDEPLHDMAYADRLATLARHDIGLWDMIAQCRRVGSLDAAVKDASVHPLANYLKTAAPRLRKIGFNGALSWKLGHPLAEQGYAVFKLPSSSPAAASVRFEDKLALWRQMFEG
ncbi:DNA-deoxyinosine glycosylase [Pigmentiphaga litoralis]|uniref:DNA-deoxyinosine glycosylase n=1 Tax=Pigmentiphaga litoralis TaxID=516702 RepID=UPI003B4335E0